MMSEIYDAHTAVARELGEENDCAVLAVSIATGVPYKEVHAKFLSLGRKPRRATPRSITYKVLAFYGFSLERVLVHQKLMEYAPGRVRMTMNHFSWFKSHFKGMHMVFSNGHVAAMSDGVLHDWAIGRKIRVNGLFKVVRSS
jgi:hypothetical protein